MSRSLATGLAKVVWPRRLVATFAKCLENFSVSAIGRSDDKIDGGGEEGRVLGWGEETIGVMGVPEGVVEGYSAEK